jgi:phosphate/sulfate permease
MHRISPVMFGVGGGKEMEAEKLSLTQLLSRLKVGQLWAVFVVVVGIVTGTFTLGYKVASTVTEGKVTCPSH